MQRLRRTRRRKGWSGEERITWRGESRRPGWWCVVRLEATRTAACTGPGWKKKEQIPAEEKESSRLELLVWLRKELLLRLPLVRVDESSWARVLLPLLSPPLLESRWQRIRFLQRREGEKERYCDCGEVAGWWMGCGVSWEGRWRDQWWRLEATAERKRKEKAGCRKTGEEKLIFCQFWAQFSPPSGHEMRPYL